MYCRACGTYNPGTNSTCKVCQTALQTVQDSVEVRIGYDLTRMPISIFRFWMYEAMGLHDYLTIIGLFFMYLGNWMIRKPYLISEFISNTPRFAILEHKIPHEIKEANSDALFQFLSAQKFEHLLTLEDKNMVSPMFQMTFRNKEKNWYASIRIQERATRVSEVQFFALTEDNHYVSVDNNFGFPIHYPNQFINKHLPTHKIEELFNVFQEMLNKVGSVPRAMSLKQYMLLLFKTRKYLLSRGLQEKLLRVQDKIRRFQFMCFGHPDRIGIHKCAGCGVPLCDACSNAFQNRFYCTFCLPLHTKSLTEVNEES